MPFQAPGPLIGRDEVLAEIEHLVDQGDMPVVTLLGPGGVGKTRLAVEIAVRMAPSFAHGAAFVDLQAARDGTDVIAAVARSLGLHSAKTRPSDALLRDALVDRHMLLVLDNLEQVIDAAAELVGDILRHAPRVRLVTTSRAPLSIAAEQQYPVPPLDTGKQGLDQSPATQLFIERARAVNPSFRVEPARIEVVADICRHLDGLPLAIELAAAKTRTMTPETIGDRLANRWDVLAGGNRDAPPRLRSMRDAIGWSHELLTDAEKELFRMLSVFAGGFTLEEAEFVHRWPHEEDRDPPTHEILQSLVDQNLVVAVEEREETRFRMLETIREFAADQMQGARDAHDVQAARAAYIRDLARRFEEKSTGPDQAMWLERIEGEFDNVVAALAWLEGQERLPDAIQIVSDLSFFINIRGHTQRFLTKLMSWLDHPQVRDDTRSRGLLLTVTGLLHLHTGQNEHAVPMLREAVGLLERAGDEKRQVVAMAFLAAGLRWSDNLREAALVADSVLAKARKTGQHRQECAALLIISTDAIITHQEKERGEAVFRQAQRIAEQHGDLWMMAFTSMGEAEGAYHDGRFEDAERAIKQARALQYSLKSRWDYPGMWAVFSHMELRRGDLDAAAHYARRGIEIAREIGRTGQVVFVTLHLARVEIEREAFHDAALLLAESLRIARREGETSKIRRCIGMYAVLAIRAGDVETGARFLGGHARLGEEQGLNYSPWSLAMEDSEQRLRTALGPAAFKRAWQEGSGLSPDDIVEQALAYTPPHSSHERERDESDNIGLSPREKDVLVQMANGLNNQEIADVLYLSYRTVTTHVTSILTKLDVPSRTAAVAFAIRNGMA